MDIKRNTRVIGVRKMIVINIIETGVIKVGNMTGLRKVITGKTEIDCTGLTERKTIVRLRKYIKNIQTILKGKDVRVKNKVLTAKMNLKKTGGWEKM